MSLNTDFFYFVCFSAQTVSVSPRRFNSPLPIMCFNSHVFTTGTVVKMILSLTLRKVFETIRARCFLKPRMVFMLITTALIEL